MVWVPPGFRMGFCVLSESAGFSLLRRRLINMCLKFERTLMLERYGVGDTVAAGSRWEGSGAE